MKSSDGQKFAFGFGKSFSERDIMQTGFGYRSLSGIVFCPIRGIELLTEFFNRIGSKLSSGDFRRMTAMRTKLPDATAAKLATTLRSRR